MNEPLTSVASKPLRWIEAMEDAGRFALLRRNAGTKTLYIHRVVQEVAKDEMSAEMRRTWTDRATRAMERVFPNVLFENWLQCERLLPQPRTAVEIAKTSGFESLITGHLLNEAAFYVYERAQYAEAEPLY